MMELDQRFVQECVDLGADVNRVFDTDGVDVMGIEDPSAIFVALAPGWRFCVGDNDVHERAFGTRRKAAHAVRNAEACSCEDCAARYGRRFDG